MSECTLAQPECYRVFLKIYYNCLDMKEPANLHYPTLIMVRGLPGSGKSYVAAALTEALGKERVVTLDPDTIDLKNEEYLAFSDKLTKEGLDKKIHPFRWLRALACEGIKAGKIVIWNQPFTIRDIFNRLVAFLQNYAVTNDIPLTTLVVEVEVDHAVAKERVTKRKQAGGHGPSDNTFIRHVADYASYADQGHNTVVVNGENDLSESVDAIIHALRKLSQK